mmetsp:Transcript_13964/g.42227  ORF Transcript_13964/g.42227 Transcript_13964/m.42227 type:complete len:326 (-) Transcript_13964:260-1237(-)|eukprot:CAMPEP_0198659802 /NCGR_PEP_ID=MMETSP1467-20131203/33872_1 /TAXON_ID=1462469 /ORGANISM="unid. sp., Strain CCMP2135" /LENGTH=325 /DNA_ID=CAMNT_0044396185 /DNA_START=22 /DNA_END=999 /DNA_ORIENTATION=-
MVSESTAIVWGTLNGAFAVGLVLVALLHWKRNDAAAGRIVAILGAAEALRAIWYFIQGYTHDRSRLLNRFAMLVQFLGMSFVAVWFSAIRRELYCRGIVDEQRIDAEKKKERTFAVAFFVINLGLWAFTLATAMIHTNVVYELNLLAIVVSFIIVSIGLLVVSRRLQLQVRLLDDQEAAYAGVLDDPEERLVRRLLFRFKVTTCSALVTVFFSFRVFAIIFHIARVGLHKHDRGLGTTHEERLFLFPWFYYTIPELFANVVLVFLTAPKDSFVNADERVLKPLIAWYAYKPPPSAHKTDGGGGQHHRAIKQRLGLTPDRTDYDIM